MAQLSPMMQQYMATKAEHKDCILFYRLGDFYEMFFDDAITASRELEITLTGKECGLEERAPMCGVPHHAVDVYINKLVQKGYKVAIAEQMEDPRFVKGIVKREVIRIITPGTITSSQALDETKNNYLMCISYIDQIFGIAIVDVTTGEFLLTEVLEVNALCDEIYKFTPVEIICNHAFFVSGVNVDDLKNRVNFAISDLEDWYFEEDRCVKALKDHFHVENLKGFGIDDYHMGIISAGVLLQYLHETQMNSLAHIATLKPYSTVKYMVIDTSTRRNLELTETLREKKKKGSLLGILDKTKTAMGARLLRNYIEQPLINKADILERQDAVEEFGKSYISREEIREYLNTIYDLERLIGKIVYKTANPRDLTAFKNSLKVLPHMKYIISNFKSNLFARLDEQLDDLQDLYELLDRAIVDEPPVLVKEGGIIKEGFNKEVDIYRKSKTEGKNWILELETKEKERTGIKTLKVKFNRVFGYYLEVTNSFKNQVPDDYIRKQTLTNAERYVTPELKELEEMILGAEDKLYSLEYDLFCKVRDKVAVEVIRIQNTAKSVATLDVLASFSAVAQQNQYVKPKINEKGIVDIKGGRHPVVEKMIPNNMFVANDVYLDNHSNLISIITGPNMAGKSTYMRQVALITLMAQIGCFVPADSANIGICDRIFTRVGASDDLASGQSTFMIEMTEVANILRNATKNSLLILDEIGRGTSTFDGLSIAWAVIEHISDTKCLGAKTLFATHYHELTELEGTLSGVNNYCIAVKEQGDDIVFLRKIVRGGADKSYGIQVAKLAGVPERVISRAKELLQELSDADITIRAKEMAKLHSIPNSKKKVPKLDEVDKNQLTLFDTVKEDDIIKEIIEMDLSNMTPFDAMNSLHVMQTKLKNRIK